MPVSLITQGKEILEDILSRFGGSAGRETTNVAQVCLLYLYTDDDA